MSSISRQNMSARSIRLALRNHRADDSYNRVTSATGASATERHLRDSDILECAPEKRSREFSARQQSDGSTLLAKLKLQPSATTLTEAQQDQSARKPRRGQLIDILV